MMKGIWYLVRVENENNIGIDEIERWKVVDSNTTSVNIGGDFNYQSMNIKCDKAVPASPITKELPATTKRPPLSTTQSSETEDSQSKGREEMYQVHTTKGSVAVDAVHVVSILNRLSKLEYESEKQKEEIESRTEQLSDELRELKDAFEAECNHYDQEISTFETTADKWTTEGNRILDLYKKEINLMKQQLSELQIAFVKKLGEPTIEAGQFVERNPDGSIRPCKIGETPYGMTVKPIYCKECGKGFAQLNIDVNGICCMCSQLEKYREKPPAESDPLEEADKQLKGIIHNLLTEKGIRIEFT